MHKTYKYIKLRGFHIKQNWQWKNFEVFISTLLNSPSKWPWKQFKEYENVCLLAITDRTTYRVLKIFCNYFKKMIYWAFTFFVWPVFSAGMSFKSETWKSRRLMVRWRCRTKFSENTVVVEWLKPRNYAICAPIQRDWCPLWYDWEKLRSIKIFDIYLLCTARLPICVAVNHALCSYEPHPSTFHSFNKLILNRPVKRKQYCTLKYWQFRVTCRLYSLKH